MFPYYYNFSLYLNYLILYFIIISKNVRVWTQDNISFKLDIKNNTDLLTKSIFNKSLLVIGGAGTIGSSYLKQLLKFKPSDIVVVDINENGLAELTHQFLARNDELHLPCVDRLSSCFPGDLMPHLSAAESFSLLPSHGHHSNQENWSNQ